jgi:hypothetical protein
MKRIREGEEEVNLNVWEECLVEDMREVITLKLNPLSLLLLSLTSKVNYERFHDTVVEKDTSTPFLLLEYGTQDLLEIGYPRRLLDHYIIHFAAMCGNIEALKWLEKQVPPYFDNPPLLDAIRSGNIDCVKWLLQRECPMNAFTFSVAAQGGNLEIMQCLKENKCPWDASTFSSAACSGSLFPMQWLKENGCPLGNGCFVECAGQGSLTNLKWLNDQLPCPKDDPFIVSAAIGGDNLENMIWLIDHGCSVNHREALSMAVTHGNLEILEYLKERIGCRLYERLWRFAIGTENLPTLEWLHKNKCPWDVHIFDVPTYYGDPRIKKWLKDHDYHYWNDDFLDE